MCRKLRGSAPPVPELGFRSASGTWDIVVVARSSPVPKSEGPGAPSVGGKQVIRLTREGVKAGPSTHHPQTEKRLGARSLGMTWLMLGRDFRDGMLVPRSFTTRTPQNAPEWLKPHRLVGHFAAWLKPCPFKAGLSGGFRLLRTRWACGGAGSRRRGRRGCRRTRRPGRRGGS